MVSTRVETSNAPLISLPFKCLWALYFPISFNKSGSWNVLANEMWTYHFQAKILICPCKTLQLSLSLLCESRRLCISDHQLQYGWLSLCQSPGTMEQNYALPKVDIKQKWELNFWCVKPLKFGAFCCCSTLFAYTD